MSREVKRVPLDFKHPIGKTWPGYLSPDVPVCAACGGSGQTASLKAFERIVQLLMVAGEDSAKRPEDFKPNGRAQTIAIPPGNPHKRLYPHPYLIEAGIDDPGTILHELTTGLAGRAPRIFGHDSCDRWGATKKIIKAAGLPEDWGYCKDCGGNGHLPEHQKILDEFVPTEPPTGDGWQMWESTSEGSPISPVFETPEKLARWLEKSKASAFGGDTATYDEWLKMIRAGWAPSAVLNTADGRGLRSGVSAVGKA